MQRAWAEKIHGQGTQRGVKDRGNIGTDSKAKVRAAVVRKSNM